MNEHQTIILKNFLAAYFHENWCLEAESPALVVAEFLADEPDIARLRDLIEAICAFCEQNRDDGELEEDLFRIYGCYYIPSADGMSVRTWLGNIRAAFIDAIARKNRRGQEGSVENLQ